MPKLLAYRTKGCTTFCFLVNGRVYVKKDVTINVPVDKLEHPKYISWNGFEGWLDTILKNTELTYEQAYLALLNPTEDYGWILELSSAMACLLKASFSPFGKKLEIPIVKYWLANGATDLCSIGELHWFDSVIRYCAPKNRSEFLRCRYLTLGSSVVPDRLKLWREIGGMKRSPEELFCFGAFGKITPKMVAVLKAITKGNKQALLANSLTDNTHEKVISEFYNEIDLEYFTGGVTTSELLKAGVRLKSLLPDLTKKEAVTLLPYLDEMFMDRGPSVLWEYIRQFLPIIPNGWRNEIQSIQVAKWAARHIKQLEKTRIVHGPGGAVRTMHYHELLKVITPEMLTNGEKTSWRGVLSRVEQVVVEQIKAELGENIKLPTLGVDTSSMSEVTPIKSTHELREEGERMHHCVGGYVRACLNRVSYIYHVGPPAPLGTTVEVCVRDKTKVIQQAMGYGNSEPKDTFVLNKFIKLLNEK